MDARRLQKKSLSPLLVAAFLLRAAAVIAAADRVEYLYIESNEGASSGGHVAVRLADNCYHFQSVGKGRIRLYRTPFEQFEHAYRVAGNRPIHTQRIDASGEAYESLRDVFETRYRRDEADFATLDALRRDAEVLRALAADEVLQRRLPGSAYFYADGETLGGNDAAVASPALAELGWRLRRLHGDDVFDRRGAQLRSAMAALRPRNSAPPVPGPATPPYRGFADRHGELLAALLAVEVLRTERPLIGAFTLRPEEGPLEDAEVTALRHLQRVLADDLVRLFNSRRSDWGFPMVVGMARLAALEMSRRERRLVVLDVYREDAGRVSAPDVRTHRARLTANLAERRADYERARREFFARATDESRLSRLEVAANLMTELRTSVATGNALRIHGEGRLPEKSARDLSAPRPSFRAGELAAARDRAAATYDAYGAALTRRHPYQIVTGNCVTEIFRLLDAAAPKQVTGDSWPPFIPFLSAREVRTRYHPSGEQRLSSYREIALARMYATENDALVYARESNTVTSRLYRREPRDSVFLFFTADTVAARPLYGAVNLGVGAGATFAGMAALPFDRGTLLRAGASGMLFSLPELGFVSIRKGTFRFVPRRWMADPTAPPSAARSDAAAGGARSQTAAQRSK